MVEDIVNVFAYLVLFLIAVIGNAMVCYVVIMRRKKGRISAVHIFTANMAISDLLFGICFPFQAIKAVVENWVFGDFMCRLDLLIRSLSIHISSFTMVVIAADRYCVITAPFNALDEHRLPLHRGIIIALIWILSALSFSFVSCSSAASY